MYHLLTSPVLRGRGIPILVACNKVDVGPKAHSISYIKKKMEKNIFEIASTNDALGTIGAKQEEEVSLVDEAKTGFKFEDLAKKRKYHRPMEVAFAQISVHEGDLDPVKEFCVRTCA